MSSIPREALNTSASKPCVIGVASSALSALARAVTPVDRNIRRGDLVHYLGGGVAEHALGADIENLNDAFGVVAMLEKLALLKIAFCRAPALSSVSPPV